MLNKDKTVVLYLFLHYNKDQTDKSRKMVV